MCSTYRPLEGFKAIHHNKTYSPFRIISAVILTSCGEPETLVNRSTQQQRIDIELADDDLFEASKIFAFLDNDVKFINDANKSFLQGLDAF